MTKRKVFSRMHAGKVFVSACLVVGSHFTASATSCSINRQVILDYVPCRRQASSCKPVTGTPVAMCTYSDTKEDCVVVRHSLTVSSYSAKLNPNSEFKLNIASVFANSVAPELLADELVLGYQVATEGDYNVVFGKYRFRTNLLPSDTSCKSPNSLGFPLRLIGNTIVPAASSLLSMGTVNVKLSEFAADAISRAFESKLKVKFWLTTLEEGTTTYSVPEVAEVELLLVKGNDSGEDTILVHAALSLDDVQPHVWNGSEVSGGSVSTPGISTFPVVAVAAGSGIGVVVISMIGFVFWRRRHQGKHVEKQELWRKESENSSVGLDAFVSPSLRGAIGAWESSADNPLGGNDDLEEGDTRNSGGTMNSHDDSEKKISNRKLKFAQFLRMQSTRSNRWLSSATFSRSTTRLGKSNTSEAESPVEPIRKSQIPLPPPLLEEEEATS